MTLTPEPSSDPCPPEKNPEKSLREWDAFFTRWGESE
jgi:hypothetical protein